MRIRLSAFVRQINRRHLLYFFALNVGWPSVFSFMGWLPEFHIGYVILALICILYAMQNGRVLPSSINKVIAAQLICFVSYYIVYNDTSYLTRSFYIFIAWALLSIQMARPKMEFIDTNVFWLALQTAMGGLGFVLTLAGLLHPISTFIEFDGHTGTFYGLYTCNAVYEGMVRVAGFFDEPGAFAFWGVVALIYNKLFIDNKKIEIMLIVGLICTLSAAYFIQVAIYGYFFYRKRMSKFLTAVILFLGLLAVVASYSEKMSDAVWGRFVFNEQTGKFNGDNRSEPATFCREVWLSSPLVGVGANNLIHISKSKGSFAGANPFTFLATDGIIGQVFLLLPLVLIYSLGRNHPKYKYAAIVLFIGCLQRPYDPTELLYPLLFLTIPLEAYREKKWGNIKRSALYQNK